MLDSVDQGPLEEQVFPRRSEYLLLDWVLSVLSQGRELLQVDDGLLEKALFPLEVQLHGHLVQSLLPVLVQEDVPVFVLLQQRLVLQVLPGLLEGEVLSLGLVEIAQRPVEEGEVLEVVSVQLGSQPFLLLGQVLLALQENSLSLQYKGLELVSLLIQGQTLIVGL